jgi:nucleosome binding factor SPN SPT16 subunit
LFIDTQREVIFLPIYGLMVPFHISTVKNASKTDDFLRLNFVTPDSTLNVGAKTDPIKHPKAIRIKEITYKMPDARELNNALR